jgi:hypothetical protein
LNKLLHVWYQNEAGALGSQMGQQLPSYLIPVQSYECFKLKKKSQVLWANEPVNGLIMQEVVSTCMHA